MEFLRPQEVEGDMEGIYVSNSLITFSFQSILLQKHQIKQKVFAQLLPPTLLKGRG